MTWFAHQVFAEPREDVVAPLRAAFGDALFRLTDLSAHWSRADRLPMPTDGLLVVRELCTPPSDDPDTLPWSWFESDAVSWLVDPVPGLAPTDAGTDLPPTALLDLLRRISTTTDTVVSLFCVGYWGGEIEYARAWTFLGREGGEVTLQQSADGDGSVTMRPVAHAGDLGRPGTPAREAGLDGDVLTTVLRHHGMHLDGGYFEAHSRGFDWAPHRLDP